MLTVRQEAVPERSPAAPPATTDLAGTGPIEDVPAVAARPAGDRYVDFLRAASLLVVVGWHWVFSIVTWHPGPWTTSPIGTTPGLWAFTWVLMPLFFFVGGFAHLVTWESVERSGGGYGQFVSRRLKRLLRPAAVCVGVVVGVWGLVQVSSIPVLHGP